jgi:hypothetical protein
MEEDIIRFRKAVKLILLMQSTLEQMDELKGTAVYKRDIKQLMNNLEVKLERFIAPHIKQIGMTDEFLMMQIQRGVDEIVSISLEDLHNFNQDNNEEKTDSKKEQE